jgi:hypothetical protein
VSTKSHPNHFVAAAAKLFTVGCGKEIRCAALPTMNNFG